MQQVRALVNVPILAVVKADAYGLGAEKVVEALAEMVDRFCVFDLKEAIDAQIHRRTGKQTLALGPPASMNPNDWHAAGVTPAISNLEQAVLLRPVRPALCVDTGMQRFSCPPDKISAVFGAGDCSEAFTHGTRVEQRSNSRSFAAGSTFRSTRAQPRFSRTRCATRCGSTRPGDLSRSSARRDNADRSA